MWNTEHRSQCQLTAHNRLSDFSPTQSQIQPALRCFISIWKCRDPSGRMLLRKQEELFIRKRDDFFFHKDFTQATYIDLILHREVLGGDECEKKEGDATADALKQHTDERDAQCINIRVVCATDVFSSHFYKPARK